MSADRLELRCVVELPGFRLEVDEAIALDDVTAVFGPSGSGKSTLLRAVAGFEQPRRGRIRCGDGLWFDRDAGIDLPPHRRPVGYMFQDARLFDHLDVAGNLAYAVRRGRALPDVDRDAVVAALELEPLLKRRVATLSGGECRRVALGRTLLRGPRLLLLDEPLTGLDRARKAEILPYLQRLPKQFHVPTLYVSHDVDEVVTLADRVLVLAAGRVQLHDTATAVIERLDLGPITGRYEPGVLVEGRVLDHDPRLHVTRLDVGGDLLIMPLLARVPVGQTLRVRIRARDVALALDRPRSLSIRNVLPGMLTELSTDPHTGDAEAWIQLRGARLRARLTLAAVEELRLHAGMAVFALIKSVSFDQLI